MAKYKIINGEGIIPNGTTEIEDYAFFYINDLTSINIPNSTTKIRKSAFSECEALTSVNIPDSVTEIGEGAFEGCKALTSVNIPNSVTKIGNFAFCECEALTSINIPESVTEIDCYYVFDSCFELAIIIVDEGNTVYDSRNNCNAIIETKTNRLIQGCANTVIPDSVTEIGERAFSSCWALTSINIPDSVTKIGEGAFQECKALTSITIPNSVTEIDNSAFSWCETLTNVNIPESVTKIDSAVFRGCLGLTSIIVADENKVYDSRNNCNAIIETKTNRLIQGCANTVIPDSVTEIGNWAFDACKRLKSITIPKSVNKIGVSVFFWCDELTSVTIPNSVTEIGYLFSSCRKLSKIILFQTDPSKIKVSEHSGLQKAQITLYVPKEGVAAFQKDSFWSECAAIKPITDDMLK